MKTLKNPKFSVTLLILKLDLRTIKNCAILGQLLGIRDGPRKLVTKICQWFWLFKHKAGALKILILFLQNQECVCTHIAHTYLFQGEACFKIRSAV